LQHLQRAQHAQRAFLQHDLADGRVAAHQPDGRDERCIHQHRAHQLGDDCDGDHSQERRKQPRVNHRRERADEHDEYSGIARDEQEQRAEHVAVELLRTTGR
jgi:hypothetical protein